MKVFFITFSFFMMLIMYLSGLFIQDTSNKSIFFGVRIPVGFEKDKRLRKIKSDYKKRFSFSFLVFVLILVLIMSQVHYEFYIFICIAAAFAGLIIINVNYYIVHKKVKALKKGEGWKLDSKRIVIVDTNYRKKDSSNKKAVVSPWWFLLPSAVIAFNVVLVLINYPLLPDKIALHLNAAGQADRWGDKSYWTVLTSCFIQIGMTAFLFGIYKLIEKAKQSLNGGEVNSVKNRSRRERYLVSIFIVAAACVVNVSFLVIGLPMIGLMEINAISLSIFVFGVFILLVILIIAEVIYRKRDIGEESPETSEDGNMVINRDDDDCYWMGTLYYNKNDPALFVEKRVGIGFDFNYAKPAAKVAMALVATLVVFVLVIVGRIPGITKGREVRVTDNSITISGHYGFTIDKSEINKIAVEDKMPKVLLKTNGADIGNKLFGKHSLEGYNNSVLFIEDKTKPVLALYTKDEALILINYTDVSKTEGLFNEIKNKIEIK